MGWSWAKAWFALLAVVNLASADPPPLEGGDEEGRELELFTLDQELNAGVSVVTRTQRPSREVPGIVSVITRDEIVSSGARDLLDILQLVPGFHFAVDVQGVLGMGVRGNWAHEGKVLLLIDGQDMVENLYSTLQWGNRWLVDNVQRVEIIRGPGSVIYGGNAELAVIHVITRNAQELDGASVSLHYARYADALSSESLSVAAGRVFGSSNEGPQVTLSANLGRGTRSNLTYRDFSGQELALGHEGRLDPATVNGSFQWKGLKARFLYDAYRVSPRDGFGDVLPESALMSFRSYHASVEYEAQLFEHLTFTPKLQYRQQLPWQVTDPTSSLYYDRKSNRYLAGATLAYTPLPSLNVLGGVELFQDTAYARGDPTLGLNSDFGGTRSLTFQNTAAFVQALYDHSIANVSLGARYEHHSRFGNSFVPRLGVTKVLDRLHFKLLASRAFRAPGIENLALTPDIRPERTTVYEGELGYQLSDQLFASMNVFDIQIQSPIVYSVDAESGTELYVNSPQTGTRGFELEARWRAPWGSADLSYSNYEGGPWDSVESYRVGGHPRLHLGFPTHQLSLRGRALLGHGLSLSPTAVLCTERFGYTNGSEGVGQLGEEPLALLVNLFLTWTPPVVAGLEIGAGVSNLLDARYRYLQPYDGGHAPLPAGSREYIIRLGYHYDFGRLDSGNRTR